MMSGIETDAIDNHIHVQSAPQAEILLRAMDQARIRTAVLMGSSRFTFTLRPRDGFTYYHENNLELLRIRKAHPDRFAVWPTLDPLAPDNCHRLEDYISDDASGLKLYVGHAFSFGTPPQYLFHTTPINSDLLQDVYGLCEKSKLPICLHVNTTDRAPGFRDEFEQVLVNHPQLRVLAPHWILASRRPTYIRSIFERFTNVCTDVSFGQDTFLEAGLRAISLNAKVIARLIKDFPDRFLCGSDIVCTSAPHKTADWMLARLLAYHHMLSSSEYECPITHERRGGLCLPKVVLSQILYGNAERLLLRD